MRQGCCVQIGLSKWAEFLYLASPDWRESMESVDELKRVPDLVCADIDNWKYYGIDEDPSSITNVSTRFGGRGVWLTAKVGEYFDFEPIWSGFFHASEWMGLYSHALTLDQVFRGFSLDHVDVLAMDIEGAETDVLETHDWHVHPHYITVEVHEESLPVDNPRSGRIKALLNEKGYKLLREQRTNLKLETPTIEIQFIKEHLL